MNENTIETNNNRQIMLTTTAEIHARYLEAAAQLDLQEHFLLQYDRFDLQGKFYEK